MLRWAHWSLILWVAPLAATGPWGATFAEPRMRSSDRLVPLHQGVLGASLLSLVAATILAVRNPARGRFKAGFAVNVFALFINAWGCLSLIGSAAWM
jgi:hypothetical protein